MASLPTGQLLTADMLTSNPSEAVSLINNHVIHTTQLFRNGITFEQNLVAQWHDATLFISDSALPYPYRFAWNFVPNVPRACLIVAADSTDGVEHVRSALFPRFSYDTGTITIKGIRGVFDVNFSYNITFLVIG
ncbi:MAG: hypothetical protein MN733_29065 [Nitrososphaera sp.]|nr:hypothetical protein [Nitrososphaera sp.]